MLAVVLDGLDGAGEVVIPGDEYRHVIVVFKGVGQHVRSQLDVGALFIRRDRRPVGIDQASQAQFGIRNRLDAVEKGLLLLVKLGLLFLPDPGVIIVNSDKLSFK